MALERNNPTDQGDAVATMTDILNTLQNLGVKVNSGGSGDYTFDNQVISPSPYIFTFPDAIATELTIINEGDNDLFYGNGKNMKVFAGSYFTFPVNGSLDNHTLISTLGTTVSYFYK